MAESMKKHRNLLLLVIDIIIIIMCQIAAILFLDTNALKSIEKNFLELIIPIFIYQFFTHILHMYKNMIRFEVGKDYIKYIFIGLLSTIVISIMSICFKFEVLHIKAIVLSGIFISGASVMYRLILRSAMIRYTVKKDNESLNKNDIVKKKPKNVLIIGAGIGARELIISMKNNFKGKYNIIGIVDDNENKLNHYILDVKVLGTREDIPKIVEKNNVDLIFFAINKIDAISRRKILEICQETGVKTRVLPTTEEVIDKQGAMNSLRDIKIEDLLGREPIELDNQNISSMIYNKVVLVTGGGGSIGSELCRQIIKYKPQQLVIVDIYENNLYDIEMELKSEYKDKDIQAVIASVRDIERLEEVFNKFKPQIVFHAAAHKHVPLMEHSPLEAIHNNVFGTYNVANCADKFNVEKFVLISTDKAVNPTNVMGASKRLCEMIVQAKNEVSNTDFVAVRFGNVLGSNGSVIPLFKKQIEKGGPVTVTHKEITRFFMTIPEAVQLILQAVTYAEGGEIFVLDMGESVKIYDLAVNLIRIMGYEPNVDIPIQITGLRPGEKLYEEILMAEEGLQSTKHDKIFISKPIHLGMEKLKEKLKILDTLKYDDTYSNQKVKDVMKTVVPTYKEPDEVNGKYNKKRDTD